MKFSSTVQIGSPKEQVFSVFSDLENAQTRIDGIQKLEFLSDVKTGLGVRWRETRVMFGKEATEEMEMTLYNVPDSYVVEAQSHGMHYSSRYQFEEVGDGVTGVNLVFEGKPLTLLAKLMTPLGLLFSGAIKKAFEKDMLDLKRHLESGANTD